MYKFRRRIVSDNPAKKARLLHCCNLALVGLLLCTTLLMRVRASQEPAQDPVKRNEVLSFEGQKVSSVEVAGQPDLKLDEVTPLLVQRGGEDFSTAKVDETVAALRRTGKFKANTSESLPK